MSCFSENTRKYLLNEVFIDVFHLIFICSVYLNVKYCQPTFPFLTFLPIISPYQLVYEVCVYIVVLYNYFMWDIYLFRSQNLLEIQLPFLHFFTLLYFIIRLSVVTYWHFMGCSREKIVTKQQQIHRHWEVTDSYHMTGLGMGEWNRWKG